MKLPCCGSGPDKTTLNVLTADTTGGVGAVVGAVVLPLFPDLQKENKNKN
jgi:hypothetical protein